MYWTMVRVTAEPVATNVLVFSDARSAPRTVGEVRAADNEVDDEEEVGTDVLL